MAQACEASRIAQHAPLLGAADASSNVSAPGVDERTCTFAETTVAPALQQSEPDGSAKRGVHPSLRYSKDGPHAHESAPKPSNSQQYFANFVMSREPPPYCKANAVDNFHSAQPAESNRNSSNPYAVRQEWPRQIGVHL